jgi:hypothetical protein
MKFLFVILAFFYLNISEACLHDNKVEFKRKLEETNLEIKIFCHNYFNSDMIETCVSENSECLKENIKKVRKITFCKNDSNIIIKAWNMCQYRKPWL